MSPILALSFFSSVTLDKSSESRQCCAMAHGAGSSRHAPVSTLWSAAPCRSPSSISTVPLRANYCRGWCHWCGASDYWASKSHNWCRRLYSITAASVNVLLVSVCFLWLKSQSLLLFLRPDALVYRHFHLVRTLDFQYINIYKIFPLLGKKVNARNLNTVLVW